jgi:hypothetical protein
LVWCCHIVGLTCDVFSNSNWIYLSLNYNDLLIEYERGRRIGITVKRVCGFVFVVFVWWLRRMFENNWWVCCIVTVWCFFLKSMALLWSLLLGRESNLCRCYAGSVCFHYFFESCFFPCIVIPQVISCKDSVVFCN